MGEHFPEGGAQRADEAYQPGNLSTAGYEQVASASGTNNEKHASGGYGAVSQVLGWLVRRAGGL